MEGLLEHTTLLAEAKRPGFQDVLDLLNNTLNDFGVPSGDDRNSKAEILLNLRINPKISIETEDDMDLVNMLQSFNNALKAADIPPLKYLMFIYGTLKRGCRLHSHIQDQQFIDVANTLAKYKMYKHKRAWYPCLVFDEKGLSIEGELWEVDEECLLRLDRVENGFCRMRIALHSPHDKEMVESYLYRYELDNNFIDVGTCWQ